MKISRALRREAVERALTLAQFFVDGESLAGVGVFSVEAAALASDAANEVVQRTNPLHRDHSCEGRAAEWEDAAKLLLSGWTP